ncbi:MAG: hypothetical protein WCK84_06810 [Bacteroidota bacterium]
MKTKILLLTTFIALNASMIFAHNPEYNSMKLEFTDGIEQMAPPEIMIMKLAPTTPKEAEFEEENTFDLINIEKLAPETPKESDFEDTNLLNPVVIDKLAPTTPAEADFLI